jgi:integrase
LASPAPAARPGQGPISDGAFLNAKQTTTVTIGFLGWLHQRTNSLSELSQHDIDAWFASGPTTRKHAVRFLYWARDQRIIDHLEVPIPRTRQADQLGPGQRLAQLHRVLTDSTIQPAPRLLAALVLLFGASLSQLTALTVDDVVDDETGTRLRLGTEPVLLPQPLVDLLRALLDDPRYRRNTVTNWHSRWLFPGARPGRPIHLYSARKMLQDIGIPARSARTGTWLQLVREAPPAVLADALGLSATAAMRYAALAGADFLSYKLEPRPAPEPEAHE